MGDSPDKKKSNKKNKYKDKIGQPKGQEPKYEGESSTAQQTQSPPVGIPQQAPQQGQGDKKGMQQQVGRQGQKGNDQGKEQQGLRQKNQEGQPDPSQPQHQGVGRGRGRGRGQRFEGGDGDRQRQQFQQTPRSDPTTGIQQQVAGMQLETRFDQQGQQEKKQKQQGRFDDGQRPRSDGQIQEQRDDRGPKQGDQQRQTQPQQQRPQTAPQAQRVSPASDLSPQSDSDPFNERKMKIDKEKIRKNELMPIHQRANAIGTRGKPIKLEVNYLEVQVAKMIDKAYHYDVAIDPETPKRLLGDAVAAFNKLHCPNVAFAYDGRKNIYTGRPIKDMTAEVVVNDLEWRREKKFKVTVKFAAEIDLGSLKTFSGNSTNTEKPQTALQCLDVVLRTAVQNNPNFVRHKRTLYHRPTTKVDLGESHELWLGLFQSCILGAKPYLNVDVSHKAFPSAKPLLDVIKDMGRGGNDCNRPLQDYFVRNLEDFLKGMNVCYKPPNLDGKLYKFNALKGPANTLKFKDENNKEMTIQQYFQGRNIRLQYPHLPTVHIGSREKTVYVPLEFCSLPPGMALNKRHPDSCTQAIIRQAATATDVRKQKIMQLLRNIPYSNSEAVRQFQISVADKFAQIVARIIDPPKLMYKSGPLVKPQRGVWNGQLFIKTPQNSIKWAIMNLENRCRDGEINEFAKKLIDQGRKQGMEFEPFRYGNSDCYEEPRMDRGRFQDRDVLKIMNDFKAKGVKLLFCIIPQSEETYAKVKQMAELRCGILTQCLKAYTVQRKMDLSTVGNILLKLNAKLNGVNHNIDPGSKPPLLKQKIMVIGADVTHPSPEQINIPSVVGVAASTDAELCRYTFAYRLQNPKDEMIRDLENIVLKNFEDYWKSNPNTLPEHIFYYRDGVSEGQFQEILTIELKAIQNAIVTMGRAKKVEWKPKVTFVCVQKRHHTRFFPLPGDYQTEGRHNNLPPGTVVDQGITKPMEYQFFLISHAAVQGVAKPAKYCILYDNAACNPDQLQGLTYYLCHMFTRCNRSVSYPAPTYYAHLAAFRGRMYIKNERIDLNNLERAYRDRSLKDDVILGHPMFFV